jgi:hypothetical protein
MIDPVDLEGIVASIRTLDQDADLRAELSARGRERARLFSPEAYQKRLVDLYGRFVGATA